MNATHNQEPLLVTTGIPLPVALNELADQVVITNATGNQDMFIKAVSTMIANIRELRPKPNQAKSAAEPPTGWQEVTPSLIANCPEWFSGKLWVACQGKVCIGQYEWRQGANPHRFYTNCGDLNALNCFVMPYIEPSAPNEHTLVTDTGGNGKAITGKSYIVA